MLKAGPNYFKKWFNIYQLCIIGFSYTNLFLEEASQDIPLKFTNNEFQFFRYFNAVAKGLQFTKLVFVFKKFQRLKQLLQTIKNISPVFFSFLLFIFVILYMFTVFALDSFSYLKQQKVVNGIDVHFQNFSMAMYSLLRIATSELWFTVVSDCVRQQSPNFTCSQISSYDDFIKKGLNGCGKTSAYAFFFIFHLLFSLIIFNIFIAFIVSAYDNEAKALKSAVSRYQLFDIKDKWHEHDKQGQGFIRYTDFLKFSQEVAVIFGFTKEDMKDLRGMRNFLKILKIPIYLNQKENIFCFKFHDAIIELSKFAVALKFGVIKYLIIWEKSSFKISLDEESNLDTHKNLRTNLKKSDENFTKTEFLSGDMFSILSFQKKLNILLGKKRRLNKMYVWDIHL